MGANYSEVVEQSFKKKCEPYTSVSKRNRVKPSKQYDLKMVGLV